MKKTTVVSETNRTIGLSEVTERKLAQVTGAATVANNPLYQGATVVNNPLYTPG